MKIDPFADFPRILRASDRKKARQNAIVSEIELLPPSAFTLVSRSAQNACCVRTSSRPPKSATFVDEVPLLPSIQVAEVNLVTQNLPPPPNTAISEQTGPKDGDDEKPASANNGEKRCLKCKMRARNAHKSVTGALKGITRAYKSDTLRVLYAQLRHEQTKHWDECEESVPCVRWPGCAIREEAQRMTRPIANPLRATMRREGR
ncbi:MAG: hypothetical protein WEB58_11295 [Planctomycetaceae bacterium]